MASFNAFGHRYNGSLEAAKDWSRVSDQKDPGYQKINFEQVNSNLNASFGAVLSTAESYRRAQQVKAGQDPKQDQAVGSMIDNLYAIEAAKNSYTHTPAANTASNQQSQQAAEAHTGTPTHRYTPKLGG